MGRVACPQCAETLPDDLRLVRRVGVCPACLRTLVLDGEGARVAVATDTVPLADSELKTLRDLRRTARKAMA